MKYILLLLLMPISLFAQQLPERSPFSELAFVWNPAMTAPYDYWEAAISYRQQWLGFDNAPRTATVAAQYPFLKDNMSIGGVFTHDRIQPLKYASLAFTYAYHLKLGLNTSDQLSVGASLNANQYLIDALEIVVTDPADALIPVGESSSLNLNAGAGFFYSTHVTKNVRRRNSRNKKSSNQNAFYIGGAINQVFPSDLVFKESNNFANWKRAMHGNFLAGVILPKEKIFLEPALWINYGNPNLYDLNVNVKMEMPEKFWAAITYSTSSTIALQLGVITLSGFAKDSYWRIGALGTYNVGSFGQYRGAGFEFMVAYRYKN